MNGMNGLRQAWLVAVREMRERARSRAFLASLVMIVAVVAAMIVLPAVLLGRDRSVDVGLSGATPAGLPATIEVQASAVGTTARLHTYATRAEGEDAVRHGTVNVLVVAGRTLEWPRSVDQRVEAVVSGAIQVVAIRDRAAAEGISPRQLTDLVAPVPLTNVELSSVAGRTSGDQTATLVMTGLLVVIISSYGGLVLTGVVEEKTSRVVEVLLARIPPRSLLAGKVMGIGLLGLAQVAVTAVAALAAVTAVGSLDVPAIRGTVIAWLVVWFVLGYALYATLFGALGALASRPEDAQSAVAPMSALMVASYLAAFAMVAQPDSVAARAISFFPSTAPLAMPGRIAMGSPAWWEPLLALAITVASIAALVRLGGRLYAAAILHGGPALSLRAAWHAAKESQPAHPRPIRRNTVNPAETTRYRVTVTILMLVGVVLGVGVGAATSDVIVGVIAGAGFIALTVQAFKLWTGHGGATVTRT